MPSDSGVSKEVKFVENGNDSPSPAQTTGTSSPSPVGNSNSSPGTTTASTENKKEPVLTPAPLPTKSPWKSVSSDIPVSKIPVESLEATKKNKPKATSSSTVKSTSSTKWVPMKASIVVSGSKKSGSGKKGSNRQSSAGSNNNGNSGRSNSTGGKKKKQTPQQQQPTSTKNKQQQTQESPSHQSGNKNENDPSDNASSATSNDKTKVKSKGDEEVEPRASSEGVQQQNKDRFNKHNENLEHPHRKQHNFNNQHHSRQQGFPRRRYYNNYHNNNNNDSYKSSHGFQHHHPKSNFTPFHSGSGRPYNSHYRGPRYGGPMHQQPVPPMYQQQFHPMQAIIIAVNSVAKQMEYYFSTENLKKDDYLRSKLSKDGYTPVTLISKFYRVNNMSFGGDPYLILASLREIVANEHSTVEIATGSLIKSNFDLDAQDKESPLAKYFIRSKEWSSLLPDEVFTEVEVEKNLQGAEMDEFLIAPVPIPPVYGSGAGPAPVPGLVPTPVSAPAPATESTAQEKEQEDETKK